MNSNSSSYPAYVGGNYNDNANYGFFYFNANNSATNTNANLGSRLLIHDLKCQSSSPLGENGILKGEPSRHDARKALIYPKGDKTMPKRLGFLYQRMLDKKQIKASIMACSKHKMKRDEVRVVMANPDFYVDELYSLLSERRYVPAVPHHKTIWDKSSGKQRTISVVPFFPDACVQRLAVDVMKPALMRGMYPHSCASIPGKGNAHASKYVKHALRNIKGSKYAAKMGIRHYYPSIRTDVVIQKLRRKIKDEEFLGLVRAIISVEGDEGLDIGFYINQWLANYILEELDWKIAKADRVEYYVRQMDDMVLIGPNKRKLHRAVDMIIEELTKMGLELKPNYQVFQVDSRGIDFVGYRFFHGYTILRKRNALRLMRRIRRVRKRQDGGTPIPFVMAAGALSLIGQLTHCDSCRFRERHVKGLDIKQLKRIVRDGTRLT